MSKPAEAAQPEPALDLGKYDVDEHNLSADEVAEKYATHLDSAHVIKSRGLTVDEAAKRLATNGPNTLKPPKTIPEWIKYLLQYTNPLLLLLVIASVLSFVAYGIQPADGKDLANIYCGAVLALLVVALATKTVRLSLPSSLLQALCKLMYTVNGYLRHMCS